MKVITPEEVKRNSRIDGTEEDALLEELCAVASDVVERALRTTWEEVEAEYGTIPAPLRHACLMLADHYYQYRGAVSPAALTTLPFGVLSLVRPYVKM